MVKIHPLTRVVPTTKPSLTAGLLPSATGFAESLLLDLLQQPVGVIAGDERDVFVGA